MSEKLLSGTWRVDPDRSTIGWSVKHLGVSTIHGTFERFEGVLADGRATGTVAAASVHTDDEQRDRFVRSDEFLDADAHPQLAFTAALSPGDPPLLEGELTIRGTTLPLGLHAERAEVLGDDAELTLAGTVRRRAYELRFHQAMGAADRSVGDEVTLALALRLVRQD